MKFTPKTRSQLSERFLLKEGSHKLFVIKAEEKDSKKGFPMIALTLKGVNHENKEVLIQDWLLEQNLEKMLNFCESSGLHEKYTIGELTEHDCINKSIWAFVTIEEGTPNPKGGQYPSKNRIKIYQTVEQVTLHDKSDKKESNTDGFSDDSIPF